MIGSISSNSNNWYQKTESLAKVQKSIESAVTANSIPTEEEKTARSKNLSLMDIMGIMQNSKLLKQEEIKEDAMDGNISSIDADGDGTISEDEYDSLISQLGIQNAPSAQDFFTKYDSDGDGEISSEEMQTKDIGKMMPPPPPIDNERDSNNSEEVFSSSTDTDGDGVISTEEYESFVENNNITDALSTEEFFNLYDTDKDGKISVDEVKQGVANTGTEYKPKTTPPSQQEEGLPSSIDIDDDGSLSTDEYEEFVESLGIKDAPSTEDFFSQYDTDEDGEITTDEVNAVFQRTANARLQAMNAYESNYRYLDDEDSDWNSAV